MLETNENREKQNYINLQFSANDIHDSIVFLGNKLIKEHPFFIKIRSTKLPKEVLGFYFYNIKELVTETVPNLKRAIECAKVKNLSPNLIEILEKKIIEESGHEKWAEEDLKKLGLRKNFLSDLKLLDSMAIFIPYIINVANNDSLSYFVYAYFIEELMVIAGPSVLNNMMVSSGVSQDSFTIISNHIEFDQDHAEEGASVLAKFLEGISESQNKNIEEIVARTNDFIWDIFSDLNRLF